MNWFKPHEHDDNNNVLASKSHFIPFREPEPEEEPCMKNMFVEKQKRNEVEYEPGVKLLMKLGKLRAKEKKNIGEKKNSKVQSSDIERLSDSLSRVLKTF